MAKKSCCRMSKARIDKIFFHFYLETFRSADGGKDTDLSVLCVFPVLTRVAAQAVMQSHIIQKIRNPL